MFSITKSNPKSLSAGSTTRTGGGKVSQSPVRKTGPRNKVRPAPTSTPKAVEPARPSKAPNGPKPLVASRVLNIAQTPGALKPVAAWKPLSIIKRSAPKATAAPTPVTPKVLDAEANDVPKAPPSLKAPDVARTYAAVVAACKPLNIVKRSSVPKAAKTARAPDLFKTPAASKVLGTLGAGDAPKATPAPKAADALKTSGTRATAIEAVRRQISEQNQKAAAVTARKAKAKSEPTLPLPAKPKVATTARVATPPSASASRPKVEGITATAKAAENAPSPGTPSRRPLPAVRKGGVRKPLAVVSKTSSSSSSPASPVHTGGCCSRHQRNSLSAAAHLSERASLTRKNAIRKRDPAIKPRISAPTPTVQRSRSAPLLGWAKVASAVPRSTSGPLILCEIVKPAVAQPVDSDAEAERKVLQVINPDTLSSDEDAADTSDTISVNTLVGSDYEDSSVHQPVAASPRPPISIRHFEIQSIVGQGGFGKVMRATLKGSQQTYAIKIVPKTKLRYEYGALVQMLQEQEVGRSVAGEQFLAGIDASFHDATNFYLVMDYHPMSLFDYWNNHARPPPTLIRLWSAEVARGLNALHKRGIIHRDVKLENVLLGADGHARVADYGLARRFEAPVAKPRVLAVYVNGQRVSKARARPMTAGVMGTLAYMAPEMLCELRYSYAVDWWAWGVLLYALCFGQFPWDHEDYDEMKRLVHTPVPLPEGAWTFDPELVAMINMALDTNPADRITFNGIQAMPFFLAINWDAVAVTSIRLPASRAKPSLPSIPSASSASSTVSLLSNDIPATSTPDAHPQFTWMSPAFAAAKVPADTILADEDLVRDAIVSLDGEAPVFDTPAAWKAAFESAESLGGSATVVSSSVSSHKKTVAPVVAKAAKGVKKWWKRVVGRKECRRA